MDKSGKRGNDRDLIYIYTGLFLIQIENKIYYFLFDDGITILLITFYKKIRLNKNTFSRIQASKIILFNRTKNRLSPN